MVQSLMGITTSFPKEGRQTSTTMTLLFNAFKKNRWEDALHIVNLIKIKKLEFDPSATFKGLIPITQTHAYDGYDFSTVEINIFSYIDSFCKGCGYDISDYIFKDSDMFSDDDDIVYKKCFVDIESIKPVWLAFIFSIFDKVMGSKWIDVFNELVLLSTCTLNDRIFRIPVYKLLVMKKHDYYFKCQIVKFNESFKQIAKNSKEFNLADLTIHNGRISCNIVAYLILIDNYTLLYHLLQNLQHVNECINKYSLLHLIEDSNVDKVKYIELLVSVGANIFAKTTDMYCFEKAVKNKNYDSAIFYFKKYKIVPLLVDTTKRLIHTILKSDPSKNKQAQLLLKTILKQAVDENIPDVITCPYNQTHPLNIACTYGVDVAKIFTDAGNKLGLNNMTSGIDKHKNTPIVTACLDKNYNMVRFLLTVATETKADIMSQTDDEGNTPLHIAYHKNYLPLIRMLSNLNRVNFSAQNNVGDTVLHIASRHCAEGVIIQLLKKINKQDINILNYKNKSGESAYSIAIKNRQYRHNVFKIFDAFIKKI